MNRKLSKLYQEDITDRNNNIPEEQLNRNDNNRISQVEQIIDDTSNFEAIDYHHAALIFQHGETLDHYQKAQDLALKAVNMGDETARWLAAAAMDRSLLMAGKAQKFGTQFIKNQDGEWELALPIDSTVTDEDRAKWHVPALADALNVYKEKYGL